MRTTLKIVLALVVVLSFLPGDWNMRVEPTPNSQAVTDLADPTVGVATSSPALCAQPAVALASQETTVSIERGWPWPIPECGICCKRSPTGRCICDVC